VLPASLVRGLPAHVPRGALGDSQDHTFPMRRLVLADRLSSVSLPMCVIELS
jgi:hypothetical protein